MALGSSAFPAGASSIGGLICGDFPRLSYARVRATIQVHLPADQLAVLKVAEASEREMLKIFSTQFAEEARP